MADSGPTNAVPSPSNKKQEWKDPFAEDVHRWLNDFVKASKAHRVYAENNEMLVRFVERAFTGLSQLLETVPELSLSVREDRLLFGKDPVHINPNREEGLPFILYRNAFRRITLVAGMDREELVKLMRAVVTDYSSFDYAGEDLVTTLWRLALPHLRYLTIDALSSDPGEAEDPEERDEIERIQGSIENIVAAIYDSNAAADDIVAGVSITKEDLEALKEIRQESQEDLDLLDQSTARAIAQVRSEDLRAIHSFLQTDTRDSLMRRLMEILVRILFKEQSARESTGTIELLTQLFDSLVVGQRLGHATELIMRLRHYAENSQSMQELHIARHLLKMFATEARVSPVLNALNEGYKSNPMTEMIGFLRALGPGISPYLLAALDSVVAPAHRRLLCDLIVELGVPDVPVLAERSATAKWFVVRDILALAQRYPLERISTLIHLALKHEHPKVRAHAVGMLRGYARGTADKLLVEHFRDPDLEVRLNAYRVAAVRRSVDAKAAIERIFELDELAEKEPKELRAMTASYALIGGADAVVALDRILSPGLLATFKDPEPQIAAAIALGSIGTEPAQAALQRGMRTLNSRVREAVKRAQVRHDPVDESHASERTPKRALESIDLPPEPDDSSVYTINPLLRQKTGDISTPTPTPTPTIGNSADIVFSARSVSPGDSLANAPEFRIGAVESAPVPEVQSVVLRPRPSMPHASRPSVSADTLPARLPPPAAVPTEVAKEPFGLEGAQVVPVDRALHAALASPVGAPPASAPRPSAAPVSPQPGAHNSASNLLRGVSVGMTESMPMRLPPAPSGPPVSSAPRAPAPPPMPPSPPQRVPPPPSVSDLLRSPPTVGAKETLPQRVPPSTSDLLRTPQSLPSFNPSPRAISQPTAAARAPQPIPTPTPAISGPVIPFQGPVARDEFDEEGDEPFEAQTQVGGRPLPTAPWSPPPSRPPPPPPATPPPPVVAPPTPEKLAALEDSFAEFLKSFDDDGKGGRR